ncbi:MAG: RIO1 family regulatory kinase/ATPase [Candidatus Micrarchaeaceae archaeon]|jgi:RIO kinase 1
MARRLGRRKRPLREKHMLVEQNKIDSGIFDDKTMIYLSKLYNKGVISKLNFITARGKEADVYIAEAGLSVKDAKYVIVKFFRIETTSFLKMSDYLVGDTRFSKIKLTKYSIIKTWCRKEMGNLRIAAKADVFAPKPYMSNGSILAMEFIGNDEGIPAPQLRNVVLQYPAQFVEIVIDQIKKLYEANLVHADLSEYNILVKDNKPYFIDFGQAVITKHPNAMLFLQRDVKNILQYFSKIYKIEKDYRQTMEYITELK